MSSGARSPRSWGCRSRSNARRTWTPRIGSTCWNGSRSNARKLDRLLKDLLDIDRLNRGIVEPQYRTADVGALTRRDGRELGCARRTHRGDRRRCRGAPGGPAEARAHRREPRDERRTAHGERPHDLGSTSNPMTTAPCSPSRTTGPGVRRTPPRGDLRAVPPGALGVLALARHRDRPVVGGPVRAAPRWRGPGWRIGPAAVPPSRCSCRPDPREPPRHRPSRAAAASTTHRRRHRRGGLGPRRRVRRRPCSSVRGAGPSPSGVARRHGRVPARTPPVHPRHRA